MLSGSYIPKEQPIPIMATPYQHLSTAIMGLATRARTKAAHLVKKETRALQEIDKEATDDKATDLTVEERRRMKLVQMGAALAKEDLCNMGLLDDAVCIHCGVEMQI